MKNKLTEKKRGIKQKWNSMSKLKRFAVLGIALFLVAGVSAGYLFGIAANSTITTHTTQGDLTITKSLTSEDWYVNESLTWSDELTLINSDGETYMYVGFDVNETNLDPTNCVLDTDEYDFTLSYSNGTIINDGTFTLPSGYSTYFVNGTALSDRNCPIEALIEISMSE